MDFPLYPRPRSLRAQRRTADLRGRPWIRLSPVLSDRLRRAAVRWRDRVAALDARAGRASAPGPEITFGAPPAEQVLLEVRPPERTLAAQEYRLTCGQHGLQVSGGDEAGLFHGLETAAQLLAEHGLTPPSCRIEDRPDLPARGAMLDVSRCKVPTLATLKQQVERLARLKINQLQLYTEHTFAFTNHRIVWQDASPLTPADILELDRFCRDRFIELVPNLNSFGHFERWLRHPEYHHLAECPDGFDHPLGGRVPWGSTLRPARDSIALLRELYAELLPNFTSSQFNVGCDETWELGEGRSRGRCARLGATEVYLEFVRKVCGLAARHDRRAMMWGDIVLREPAAIQRLPSDITLLNWGYEANHPFARQCEELNRSGYAFYVCPGTSSWNALIGRSSNARENLVNAARNGTRWGAAGYLITDWGDHGHHQYQPLSYAPLLLGACYAWCLRSNRDCDPVAGVNRIFLDSPASPLGGILWDLGRVEERLSTRVPNGTLCNRLLFWNLTDAPPASLVAEPGRIEECIAALHEIGERLTDSQSAESDGALIRDELRNAIAMARHGFDRYLLYARKRRARKQLRRDLQAIIGEHERLWLTRNRPGGLAESRGRLERSLAPLQD